MSVGIVGGGAAGMMAAVAVAQSGTTPFLYERNPRLGIKILISGGGRCNITHDTDAAGVERGFIPREARFLRHALHLFPPTRLLQMLHAEGLATYTRPNGRVFPESGRADDVLSALEAILEHHRVQVLTRTLVTGVEISAGGGRILTEKGGEEHDAVIVATGGLSYRKVGTTGDGIAWGSAAGVRVEPVRGALAPIHFNPPPPRDWQGVALRDVRLTVIAPDGGAPVPKKEGYPTTWRDDLLFTHRGVSGPAVLEVSRAVARGSELHGRVLLAIDLLPDVSRDELAERWGERLEASPRSEVQTFVEQMLPRVLVPFLLDSCGISPGLRLADTRRDLRDRLLETLKRWIPGEIGEVPIDRGEVTAGGIALEEVDPKTMESKRIPRLFFAGEVLDVAGSVGGFNLQAAFATGWTAGLAAARYASTRAEDPSHERWRRP